MKKVYLGNILNIIQVYADTNKKICESNGTPKDITDWSYDLLISLKQFIKEKANEI